MNQKKKLIEVTAEMTQNKENPRPDFEPYVGQLLTVIAWLWARTVKVGKPKDAEGAKNGTKLTRANFGCLMSATPVSGDYIKAEGRAGRLGAWSMAIVAEGTRGRVYLGGAFTHQYGDRADLVSSATGWCVGS